MVYSLPMSLSCARCGAPIPPDEVSPELGLARCPSCDHVFDLPVSAAAPPPSPSSTSRASAELRPLPLDAPRGVTFAQSGSALVLDYRWFHMKHVLFAVFSVAWVGFLVVWVGIASEGEPVMALLSLFHVAVGLWLAYLAVTGFVNHTIITVGRGQLQVEHTPLPWPGNRTVPTSAIDQLYVKRVVRRTKNGKSITYQLRLQTKAGRDLKLLGGMPTPTAAQFLERVTEQHLGIVDRPVYGEL